MKLSTRVSLFACLLVAAAATAVTSNVRHPEPALMVTDLSPAAYAAVKDEFLDIVETASPRVALTELRARIKTDQALLRSCHPLVHAIGHEAYKKYQDFAQAMAYQDEICNSGYLHGVIEEYFSHSDNIFKTMQTICADQPEGSFIGWECYHGVGHGVMVNTSNDLPQSLSLCDSYASEFARSNCANGVFMENFNADDDLHPSEYLKKDDFFYPCAMQAEKHKTDCYYYAPTYYLRMHPNDYDTALDWCKTAENEYQFACALGVGGQMMKENIEQPLEIAKICARHAEFENACVAGMVGIYINHYGALEPAVDLCPQLKKAQQGICEQETKRRAGEFSSL